MAIPRRTFRPDEHIRRRKDFQEAYAHGTRLSGRYMTVFVRPTTLEVPRLGVTATKKIGGAVKRNRAKRLIREVFRSNKPGRAVDVVILPRASVFDVPRATLEADYLSVMARTSSVRRRASA